MLIRVCCKVVTCLDPLTSSWEQLVKVSQALTRLEQLKEKTDMNKRRSQLSKT